MSFQLALLAWADPCPFWETSSSPLTFDVACRCFNDLSRSPLNYYYFFPDEFSGVLNPYICRKSVFLWSLYCKLGVPWWFSGKESTCQAVNAGSIPGSGRSPREGHGNPLQYSCLGNPMDRGAWWAALHGIARVAHSWVTEQAGVCCKSPANMTARSFPLQDIYSKYVPQQCTSPCKTWWVPCLIITLVALDK